MMEWLPQALRLGISEDKFWTMNPNKMRPYIKAKNDEQKEQLERDNIVAFIQARYFCDSLASTVGRMFGGHAEFPEQPYDLFGQEKQKKPEDMTEEEKLEQVKLFFGELETMQRNFELEKSGKA